MWEWKKVGSLFIFLVFTFLTVYTLKPSSSGFRTISSRSSIYDEKIQPIFDRRCVACHSCFNSPCQLNLSSYEGVTRGATTTPVYDLARFFSTKPTRLLIDEKSDEGWRERGFFSVTDPHVSTFEDRPSLMSLMLKGSDDDNGKGVNFDSEEDNFCASFDFKSVRKGKDRKKKYKRIDHFFKTRPWAKMPYGFPALEQEEHDELVDWINKGAIGPEGFRGTKGVYYNFDQFSDELLSKLQQFEDLFNGSSNKDKLSSRYIYEKLFLGHLYFEDLDNEKIKFFRLVRSTTKTGFVDEIATTRPYDDPGIEKFYYRFVPIKETIVHKTHITYPLSDKKMKRYRELFYDAKWESEDITLPSYSLKESANPFITFKQIPARNRYQFMLDNAHFIVMSFIRGPVCRGQVALNVIDDHFWVTFIDPDADPFIKNNAILDQVAPFLTTPAADAGAKKGFGEFYSNQIEYRKLRVKAYEGESLSVDSFWDGDGHNKDAFLTVYRHYDSATVLKGHQGEVPKTVWTMDYPIFEDIFYNLVSGYNVFEALPHHLKSRVYMEYSRINSQDTFISFLPNEARESVRERWTQSKKKTKPGRFDKFFYENLPDYLLPSKADQKMRFRYPFLADEIKTDVQYKKNSLFSYKKQLLSQIWNKNEKVLLTDSINCCGFDEKKINQIHSFNDFREALKSIASKQESYARAIPDLNYIRVRSESGDRAYTMIHNKEHYNVSYLFDEESRRWPEKDTLHFYEGFVGSYPNFFFDIELSQAKQFLDDLVKLDGKERSFKTFASKYGVSRHNPNFWKVFDFFTDEFKSLNPVEFGIFDLNRYESY